VLFYLICRKTEKSVSRNTGLLSCRSSYVSEESPYSLNSYTGASTKNKQSAIFGMDGQSCYASDETITRL